VFCGGAASFCSIYLDVWTALRFVMYSAGLRTKVSCVCIFSETAGGVVGNEWTQVECSAHYSSTAHTKVVKRLVVLSFVNQGEA